jgi:hypothetical protein
MKPENQVAKIARELDKLALDITEIRIAADAEYQAERARGLAKQLRDIARTNIHGGGTGQD